MEGGAADLDGRLIVGDEITHINGMSVMDASHREVISLMGEAAAQGEVVLGIRRKMPLPGEEAVFVGKCTCVCVSKCMVGGGAVMILTYLV